MGTHTSGVPSRATLHNLKVKCLQLLFFATGTSGAWPNPSGCSSPTLAPSLRTRSSRVGQLLTLISPAGMTTSFHLAWTSPTCLTTSTGTKITQSNAILRHIARKHDLVGKTEKEKAMADMMADQAMDFRNGWVRLCYNSNFENVKDDYLK